MPMLSAARSSYHATSSDTDLLYVALSDFARHLLQLQREGCTNEFPAIAQAIEHLHIEGDPYVREAATIGLLEGIQNVWANEGVNPKLFSSYLLPVSLKRWGSLCDFWAGKTKSIGENL